MARIPTRSQVIYYRDVPIYAFENGVKTYSYVVDGKTYENQKDAMLAVDMLREP